MDCLDRWAFQDPVVQQAHRDHVVIQDYVDLPVLLGIRARQAYKVNEAKLDHQDQSV